MVVHQAIGQRDGIETSDGLPNDGEEGLAVGIVVKDRLAAITARSDVVDRARSLAEVNYSFTKYAILYKY